MTHLIHFEYRKLLHMKSFYICAIVMTISLLVAIATINYYEKNEVKAPESTTGNVTVEVGVDPSLKNENFNMNDFINGASNGVSITIFLAVVVSLFTCMDYSNGAIKNVISKGYRRSRVWLSKFIVTMSISILYSVFVMAVGGIIAGIFYGFDTKLTNDSILQLAVQTLVISAFSSGFFLLGMICKKSGGAIALAIIIPNIIPLISGLADAVINSEKIKIANYTLTGCLESLSETGVASDIVTRSAICALCAVVYLVIFTALSFVVTNNVEV